MRNTPLEAKLGFDKIRQTISNRCLTDYAARRVQEEDFSTDKNIISTRLNLCDEMRLVMMFEDNFPTTTSASLTSDMPTAALCLMP